MAEVIVHIAEDRHLHHDRDDEQKHRQRDHDDDHDDHDDHGLTEDAAARPLPGAHRYHGMLYGVIVGGIPSHVLEHASQIRQFLTAAGVKVQPMPGDRRYAA